MFTKTNQERVPKIAAMTRFNETFEQLRNCKAIRVQTVYDACFKHTFKLKTVKPGFEAICLKLCMNAQIYKGFPLASELYITISITH